MKTGISIGAIVALLLGGTWLSGSLANNNPDVLSQNGLHWHPLLTIYVKGEKVDIPQNIGIGPAYTSMPTFDSAMRMTAMHTHEDVPIIHLEFSGVVRKEDVMLGSFFRIWGREMHSLGTDVRMTVNGKENTEYENYVMHDADKIELRYD